MDKLSILLGMENPSETWSIIREIALSKGVTEEALRKWKARGVPGKWQLPIILASGGRLGPADVTLAAEAQS